MPCGRELWLVWVQVVMQGYGGTVLLVGLEESLWAAKGR